MVAGAVLALVLASLIFSLILEPVYRVEATVDVVPVQVGTSDPLEPAAFVQQVQGAIINEDADDLLQEAARQAGWTGDLETLEDRFDLETVTRAEDGYSLRIGFSGPEAEGAVRAANAYATLFARRIDELNDQRPVGGTLPARASVEGRASIPENPVRPRPLLYAAVAAGAGLLLGGVVALLLEDRARDWRGPRDAELTLRVPVLGAVPEYPSGEASGEAAGHGSGQEKETV